MMDFWHVGITHFSSLHNHLKSALYPVCGIGGESSAECNGGWAGTKEAFSPCGLKCSLL